jgi:hypothetical protein
MSKRDLADTAIANFFYENNIAFNAASSASYRLMVQRIKEAPDSHPPPDRKVKWTAADEICKLNLSLVQAAAIVALRFKNWIEDEWEFQAIVTKNTATYDALMGKYKFLYFIDPDGDNGAIEVRRVVDIEWQLRRAGGTVSKYNVVTQLVSKDEEAVEGDEDYIPYEINEALHNMIKSAHQHNINYIMVQKE